MLNYGGFYTFGFTGGAVIGPLAETTNWALLLRSVDTVEWHLQSNSSSENCQCRHDRPETTPSIFGAELKFNLDHGFTWKTSTYYIKETFINKLLPVIRLILVLFLESHILYSYNTGNLFSQSTLFLWSIPRN